jgi:hypothetical protein
MDKVHVPIKVNHDGVATHKYNVDNEGHGCVPTLANNFNEQFKHENYSVEAIEKDYKERVYYNQRSGGDGWFHGRVTNAYRNGYDLIFGKKS